MKNLRSQQGFTLIELMVVLLIVAIIAAFAYPSYISSVQKSRRTDAITSLNEIMHLQEEYFIRNRSYAKDLTQLGYSANTIDSANKDYAITMTVEPSACSGNNTQTCEAFEISAQPKSTSTQAKDDTCQVMSINSRGLKKSQNKEDETSTASCWH